MDSKKEPDSEDLGSIRWAEASSSTPTKQEKCQSKVAVRLSKPTTISKTHEKHDQGSFSMDVVAFEKSLQEKRDRKFLGQSPRIEIHLRDMTTKSPGDSLSKEFSTSQELQDKAESVDEVDNISMPRQIKRVLTYEKVLKIKTVHESKTNQNFKSPIGQRTVDCLVDKSSSTEQVSTTEDSAYHSHRVRITSCGTPTTISISSSSNSLLHGFMSDENVYTQGTSSRERVSVERTDSESPQLADFVDDNSKNLSSFDSGKFTYIDHTATAQQTSVADSNENIRRHSKLVRPDTEDCSRVWYNEYKTQTFLMDCPQKMDFKRSNSQYDNHIRQIRGTTYF